MNTQKEKATISIVNLRDAILGELPNQMVEQIHYDLLMSLLGDYFGDRLDLVLFKQPDRYCYNEFFALYINDVVLDYIYWENPDKFKIDYRDLYYYTND